MINTDWAAMVLSDPVATERRLGLTSLRRVGTPEEVVQAALFFAPEASSFITGQTMVVNGGMLVSYGN